MKNDSHDLEIIDLGVVGYDACKNLQLEMVQERLAEKIPDRLLFVSHPPVITTGKRSGAQDLLSTPEELLKREIHIVGTDRGGKTTFHGPGQLVAYPILMLKKRDIHAYVHNLLHVLLFALGDYGLNGELRRGNPGVWIEGRKIASLGIAVKKWVTYHGIALNVSPQLSNFDLIVPCGDPTQAMTSMEKELGRSLDMNDVEERFTHHFRAAFGYRATEKSRFVPQDR